MKYTLNKEVDVSSGWDVIVVGGGPAGCTAAAAAARQGAKTLLIEATGALGGMGTSGMVPAWCPFSDKEKIIYRGLAEKVFTACKKGMPHIKPEAMDWVAIDAELLKRIYDDLVTGFGAEVLFFSYCVGVDRDESGRVHTLLIANKGGITAYQAKIVVDCTGDADMCAFAGAEFAMGDENGRTMATTHCFLLTNVDEFAFLNGPALYKADPNSPIWKIAPDPEFPLIRDHHLCQNLVGPRAVGFNSGHLWDVDPTNPSSMSKAMMDGRRLAVQIRDALAKHQPKAFANAWLATTASLMGVRESRRILGEYTLTFDDWLQRRSFPDEICRNSYFVDMHASTGRTKEQLQAGKKGSVQPEHEYKKGESHGIPYRCLQPKGLRNVLTAGRAVSCERMVQGSIRVMPVCLAMGEAAGVAAALACQTDDGDVRSVNTANLRKMLLEHGAYLPDVKEK